MRRLIAPSEEYMRAFAPALKMAQLAWRCAGVMFAAPLISFQKAVPKVRLFAIMKPLSTIGPASPCCIRAT